MKNKIKFVFTAILSIIVLVACSPEEFDDYSMGELYTIGQDQFAFDITPTVSGNQWTYDYSASFNVDPVKYPFYYEIRFGDGKIATVTSGSGKLLTEAFGSHTYVVAAGEYIAQCIVYTPNGDFTVKEKTIVIAQDNPDYYSDDPESPQFALTGGKDNLQGKEWMIGEGSGLGPGDGTWGEWWQIADNSAIQNDAFTFKPDNVHPRGAYLYDNGGDTFMNESLGDLFPDGDPAGSFITTAYTPPSNATWSIEVKNGLYHLVIDKGFIAYPVTPDDLTKTEYEILEYSATEIRLRYASPDGNGWYFILVSEEPEDVVNLTGGKNMPEGKTWMLQESEGFGLGPAGAGWNEWWAVTPSTDGAAAAFDDELTFVSNGKAKLNNNGNSFMNESTAGLFADGNPDGSFATEYYTPADDASWNFTSVDDVNYLVLKNVFPMYAVTPESIEEARYKIAELREDFIHLVFETDGVDWNFYLVPKP